MRRIHHPPVPHENPHMRDFVCAIPARSPEDHVARLGLGARHVLAHGGMVLGLRGTRDGLVKGLADGVLGEAGAIEAAGRRA